MMGVLALAALLAACTRGPRPWTQEEALAGALARADVDGDGSVEQADWDALAYGPLSWGMADTDRSGDLSAAELAVTMSAQDPLTFDSPPLRGAPGSALQLEYFGATWPVRTMRDLLFFLDAEVRSVDPDAELPHEDRLRLAAASKRINSPQTAEALGGLRKATLDAGLTWPPLLGGNSEKKP